MVELAQFRPVLCWVDETNGLVLFNGPISSIQHRTTPHPAQDWVSAGLEPAPDNISTNDRFDI